MYICVGLKPNQKDAVQHSKFHTLASFKLDWCNVKKNKNLILLKITKEINRDKCCNKNLNI